MLARGDSPTAKQSARRRPENARIQPFIVLGCVSEKHSCALRGRAGRPVPSRSVRTMVCRAVYVKIVFEEDRQTLVHDTARRDLGVRSSATGTRRAAAPGAAKGIGCAELGFPLSGSSTTLRLQDSKQHASTDRQVQLQPSQMSASTEAASGDHGSAESRSISEYGALRHLGLAFTVSRHSTSMPLLLGRRSDLYRSSGPRNSVDRPNGKRATMKASLARSVEEMDDGEGVGPRHDEALLAGDRRQQFSAVAPSGRRPTPPAASRSRGGPAHARARRPARAAAAGRQHDRRRKAAPTRPPEAGKENRSTRSAASAQAGGSSPTT